MNICWFYKRPRLKSVTLKGLRKYAKKIAESSALGLLTINEWDKKGFRKDGDKSSFVQANTSSHWSLSLSSIKVMTWWQWWEISWCFAQSVDKINHRSIILPLATINSIDKNRVKLDWLKNSETLILYFSYLYFGILHLVFLYFVFM